MGYVQMTLDDWMGIKESLKKDLQGVSESFVRIGYKLRQIEDGKLYEKDGHVTVAEFAEAEYGLDASTVSRFMAINRKYSVGGYSQALRPEFAGFGSSKLSEMLRLPEGDLEMIRPEAAREQIRELKRFNRSAPAGGEGGGMDTLVEKFFEADRELLDGIYESREFLDGNIKGMAELANPSGSRYFQNGLYFLSMYEDTVKVKKFGQQPEELAWERFFGIMKEVFGEEPGKKKWEEHFGKKAGEGEEKIAPAQKPEPPINTESGGQSGEKGTPGQKKEPKMPEKPMDTERGRYSEEELPGQMEMTRDFREYCQGETEPREGAGTPGGETGEPGEQEEAPAEEPEAAAGRPYKSRFEYLRTLSQSEYARHMAEAMKGLKGLSFRDLTQERIWEEWLEGLVDETGRTIEEGIA